MESFISLRALLERADMNERQFACAVGLPNDCAVSDYIDHPRRLSVRQKQRAFEILHMTQDEVNLILFENKVPQMRPRATKCLEYRQAEKPLSKEDFSLIAQTWRRLYHIYDAQAEMRRNQAGAGERRRARLESRLCQSKLDGLHSELELIRRLDRVRGFIRQRPENERSVLFGRYVMGLQWSKVAKQAGFSVDHCYTLHRMALRSLENETDD